MDKKSKNTLIVSIIALALVLIGVTYAYFSARITGLESASTLSLTAGRMGIVYSEGDENVSVSNIYPREEAWLTKTITLTGYNTTDQEMKYELGINIGNNTFKGGELTFDLIGVGEVGTKIPDIIGKSIVGHDRFFRFGTGSFINADGDTHVYTLKIYFKDNGRTQNYNQEAVFNGHIHVKEPNKYVAIVNTSSQNHNGKHCYTDNYTPGGFISYGQEYVNGQYTYKYEKTASKSGWSNLRSGEHGWGVMLTDKNSTDPVTTELCAYVNEIPVVSLAYMFYQSKSTSIDLSSFDTSNVTNMSGMFESSKFSSIDVSSFDTSKVITMNRMFCAASATTLTGMPSFDTSNVTIMTDMFAYSKFNSLDLSSFDTSNVTSMSSMFYRTSATEIIGLDGFDTSKVTHMNSMFSYAIVQTLDLSSFDTSKVTNMTYMFNFSKATQIIGLDNFDTSNVTDMTGMFSFVDVINLDLSSFDTSKVTRMYEMFRMATTETIDVSSFNTFNVTNMYHMFDYCTKLTGLDLSSFDTSKVTDMSGMLQQLKFTIGYAGTKADADRFNNVAGSLSNGNDPITAKPSTLTFVVK